MDYTKTLTLLSAVKNMKKASSFLRDRYFPTNENTDIFNSEAVILEYRDGSKKAAPFVVEQKNGVAVTRNGYDVESFTPANIAPKRPQSVSDLRKKGFGEALYSNLSPEARALALTVQDMIELEQMITRREEAMAAQVLFNNKVTMNYYADDLSLAETKEIKFYEGAVNPDVYTPQNLWSSASANILGDIEAMGRTIRNNGHVATDVILGTAAADAFINNEAVQKLLDNRNVNIGAYDPIILDDPYAALLARLNIKGHVYNFITYDAAYEELDGTVTNFVPTKQIAVTAEGVGRTAYGAVSQIEADGEFHTYAGTRVPHAVADQGTNSKDIILTAKPLPILNSKDSVISATVLS